MIYESVRQQKLAKVLDDRELSVKAKLFLDSKGIKHYIVERDLKLPTCCRIWWLDSFVLYWLAKEHPFLSKTSILLGYTFIGGGISGTGMLLGCRVWICIAFLLFASLVAYTTISVFVTLAHAVSEMRLNSLGIDCRQYGYYNCRTFGELDDSISNEEISKEISNLPKTM